GVLVQPSARNLAAAYSQIQQLGNLTGHKRPAAALVKRMKRSIAKAIASTPRRRLAVYHELSPDYYSATSKTFIGGIYKLFGLRNNPDPAGSRGSRHPQVSAGDILSANPSLIRLPDTPCSGQDTSAVARRPR